MKLLLAAALLLAVASVQGGVTRDDPGWILRLRDDGKPLVGYLREAKPEARFDPSEVTFHLFTKGSPNFSSQMFVGDLNRAPFDPAKDTKFIVHGYTSSGFTNWIIDIKNKYMAAGDYNVITVDWERPASFPYDNAKFRADPTGTYLGEFMAYLTSQGGDLNRFHCTGHSLGAHVCGFAGEALGGALGRITGLDPALPLYDYGNLGERLDPSDGKFVDVIHTCGGWLAFWHPLGHADFYPNNGESSQPGCGVDVTGSCSHDRSHELFEESILSSNFRSLRCDSWADFRGGACDGNQEMVMGEHATSSASGAYYLETMGRPPFAMG